MADTEGLRARLPRPLDEFLEPIIDGMEPSSLGQLSRERAATLDESLRGLSTARQHAAVDSRTFVVVHRGH